MVVAAVGVELEEEVQVGAASAVAGTVGGAWEEEVAVVAALVAVAMVEGAWVAAELEVVAWVVGLEGAKAAVWVAGAVVDWVAWRAADGTQ